MARECIAENYEAIAPDRHVRSSPQLPLGRRESAFVVAHRSIDNVPAEFDNGFQLVDDATEQTSQSTYLKRAHNGGVRNPLEAVQLTAGFATGFATSVYDNVRFLADNGFVKIGQAAWQSTSVAFDYYTHTAPSAIAGDAGQAVGWVERQSSLWLYRYSRMDAWHRGQELGHLSSFLVPYGTCRQAALLPEIEANIAVLGAEGATKLDCATAPKASWLSDFWKRTGKAEKSQEDAAENMSKLADQSAPQEVLIRELIAKSRVPASEQFRAEVQDGLRSVPQRDLEDLARNKWRIEMPKTLADYDAKRAMRSIKPGGAEVHEQTNAITISERRHIVVPELMRASNGELASNIGVGADLVRHEIGHVLCEQRGWLQDPYLHQAFMKEGEELINRARTMPGSDYERLAKNFFVKRPNAREEVVCNLYAEMNGGCGLESELVATMRKSFRGTLKRLADLNKRTQ